MLESGELISMRQRGVRSCFVALVQALSQPEWWKLVRWLLSLVLPWKSRRDEASRNQLGISWRGMAGFKCFIRIFRSSAGCFFRQRGFRRRTVWSDQAKLNKHDLHGPALCPLHASGLNFRCIHLKPNMIQDPRPLVLLSLNQYQWAHVHHVASLPAHPLLRFSSPS